MIPLTRRDLCVAVLTASVCLGLTGFLAADSAPRAAEAPAAKPPMGSKAIDWQKQPVKPNKAGVVRKVCQAPTATLDELECHVTTLEPGQTSHPPHQHPEEELFVIKEGTVESLVAGEWVKLGPGSVIFQASNIDHAIRNAGDTPATYHVFKWHSPGMLAKRDAAKAAK